MIVDSKLAKNFKYVILEKFKIVDELLFDQKKAYELS